MKTFAFASLFTLSLLAGCSKGSPAAADHDHEHEHGPNGGHVVELTGGAGHMEVIHKKGVGEMELIFTKEDEKTPLLIAAPLVFKVEQGKEWLEIAAAAVNPAEGKAATYRAAHEAFKQDHVHGRVTFVIDGVTHNPELPEGH